MPPFETATLFYQVLEAAHAALANYLTVVFAVLVVSYLAAEKLDRTAMVFLLLVYSLFCIGMIREIVGLYLDLARLSWQIAQEPGDVFEWHGLSRSLTTGPPWEIPVAVGLMCSLAYVGSLLFLYRLRRDPSRKAQNRQDGAASNAG